MHNFNFLFCILPRFLWWFCLKKLSIHCNFFSLTLLFWSENLQQFCLSPCRELAFSHTWREANITSCQPFFAFANRDGSKLWVYLVSKYIVWLQTLKHKLTSNCSPSLLKWSAFSQVSFDFHGFLAQVLITEPPWEPWPMPWRFSGLYIFFLRDIMR